MRIYYLVSTYESGGAELAIPGIVRVMEEAGHEVRVTALRRRNGGAVRFLKQAGITPHLLFSGRRGRLHLIFRAFWDIRAFAPDIVMTANRATVVGQVAGALLGIPVVSFWHSCSLRRFTLLLRNFSRLWIADSDGVAHYVQERIGVSPEKILTWPLFHCAEAHRPNVVPAAGGGGGLRIGSVGRLDEVKNFHVLLAAFSDFLKDNPGRAGYATLSLAGDGPDRKRLENLAEALGIAEQVRFTGFLDDVKPFLAELDFYVQPSRYEGLCIAMHEAMGAGVPVAATPVGEMKTALGEGRRGVVLDPDHLRQSILQALRMAECGETARFGKAGRAYVQERFGPAAFSLAGGAVIERMKKMKRRRFLAF